jgi:glutathione S-transferase kappa 1
MSEYTITLYYDIVSPYSYIGLTTLSRVCPQWNVQLKLSPVYLGSIMKQSQNSPPAMVPNKANYLTADLQRLSAYYALPISIPDYFPELMFKSLSLMRLLAAVELYYPPRLHALTSILFKFIFEANKNVLQPSTITAALSSAGFTAEEQAKLLEAAGSEAVKNSLRTNTEAALSAGTFGVPTFIISKPRDKDFSPQMLFGSDRIHIAAHIMGKEFDWKPSAELSKPISSKL